MLIQEFEKLTGMQVSMEEYAVIEQMYYDFDGDKRKFCEDFMKRGRIKEVNQKIIAALHEELGKAYDEFRRVKRDLAIVQNELEKEHEWEPYEYKQNVSQLAYEKLAGQSDTRELTDEEAVKLIADEWGFQPEKIRIIRTVNRIEKDRHGRCRKAGEYERKPLYNATDWNYIRFDIAHSMTYEMHDGMLQFFVH